MEEKILPNIKRLFFGFEVDGAWDEAFPSGRVLLQEDRHTTAAFLGSLDLDQVRHVIDSMPLPSWKIGLAAIASRLLILPRCVAFEFELQESSDLFFSYQKELSSHLVKNGLLKEKEQHRAFLPHVTLSRPPFNKQKWKEYFKKIPLSIGSFHLYESLGGSRYQKVWTHSMLSPFEEIAHTADIAFTVRGYDLKSLSLHAFFALATKAPSLLNYGFETNAFATLEDLVAGLNASIALLDIDEGSPLKAVSYHGDISKADGVLEWRMVVDV